MSKQKTITVSVFNPNTDADTVKYLREILISKLGKVGSYPNITAKTCQS